MPAPDRQAVPRQRALEFLRQGGYSFQPPEVEAVFNRGHRVSMSPGGIYRETAGLEPAVVEKPVA